MPYTKEAPRNLWFVEVAAHTRSGWSPQLINSELPPSGKLCDGGEIVMRDAPRLITAVDRGLTLDELSAKYGYLKHTRQQAEEQQRNKLADSISVELMRKPEAFGDLLAAMHRNGVFMDSGFRAAIKTPENYNAVTALLHALRGN